MIPTATIQKAAEAIEPDYDAALKEALAQISRMHLFPDDAVNRTTLSAAVKIARAALAEQKG